MSLKRILFVDDDPNVLEGLRNTFHKQRHQWQMAFALGGEAALVELARAPFDVVVTDMRMPRVDGAALLGHVQRDYPNVARIVLSGHADRDTLVRAVPVAHQFLSKPCDAEVLQVVIEQTCGLQALLHDERMRRVTARLGKLPSAPRCYLDLTAAATDPDKGLADIASIIERDPAMAAKVLQLVNGAYFGLGSRITSVQRAVVYLGVDLIQGLALSAEVFATLRGAKIADGFSLDELQEHSLLTARLAKRLVADPKRVEEAFAAAIVHDIGKVILALGFPQEYSEVIRTAREAGRDTHLVENDAFGVSHAEVGAYLLGVWGLPLSIVEAVADHHTPRRASVGAREVMTAVHVADAFVHAAAGGPTNLLDLAFVEESGLGPVLSEWKVVAARELRTATAAA